MSNNFTNDQPSGPLAGVRIVEWGTNFSVPLASMALADQGADVIKLESPVGDGTRNATAHREGVAGMSASFVVANRNKRSISIDAKRPEAIEVILELIKKADVFIQNFRPGVMERFGLGYEDIKSVKNDIIYVSVSGFGSTGPYSKQRTWDPVVQAVSGMMTMQADPETGQPCQMRSSVADKVTAMTTSQAITAALFHHAKTGQGQHVEVDMLSAALTFNWTSAMLNHMWLGENIRLGANLKELKLIYKTSDGYICAIGISNDDWKGLVTALDRTDLIEDRRFKESFDRLKNSKEIAQELAPHFLTKTSAEWLKLLAECDAVFAPVNGPDDIHLDPQVVASGIVEETNHPHAGRYRQTAHPAKFSQTPAQFTRHPPMLGEQTDEILNEAGFSIERISELRNSGAVK